MKRFSLASASPRRLELLSLSAWEIEQRPSEVDESPLPSETPEDYTRRLARAKAEALDGGTGWILAADTVVAADGELLGKPTDVKHARALLDQLRGQTHRVVTSIALVDTRDGSLTLDTCVSDVPMRDYSDAEIDRYVESGEAADKAGAYAIQSDSFEPVDVAEMRDCYANVMGLPLCHVARNLSRLQRPLEVDIASRCQEHTGYDCPIHAKILSWDD